MRQAYGLILMAALWVQGAQAQGWPVEFYDPGADKAPADLVPNP